MKRTLPVLIIFPVLISGVFAAVALNQKITHGPSRISKKITSPLKEKAKDMAKDQIKDEIAERAAKAILEVFDQDRGGDAHSKEVFVKDLIAGTGAFSSGADIFFTGSEANPMDKDSPPSFTGGNNFIPISPPSLDGVTSPEQSSLSTWNGGYPYIPPASLASTQPPAAVPVQRELIDRSTPPVKFVGPDPVREPPVMVAHEAVHERPLVERARPEPARENVRERDTMVASR